MSKEENPTCKYCLQVVKVEQAEQSVLLIYRMNRRKNKGTKGKNEEYD